MPHDESDTARRPKSKIVTIVSESTTFQNRSQLFNSVESLRHEAVYTRLRASYRAPGKIIIPHSYWAKVTANPSFEIIAISVICGNSVWLGIDTDMNHAPSLASSPIIFVVMENFFCFFFSFEIITRYHAVRRKWHCFRDGWFVFDLILVVIMVIETWLLPLIHGSSDLPFGVFRLIRLLRLTRMVRLMRMLPSMMIVIKGLQAACKAMFFTFVLLVLLMYAFGIMFQMAIGSHPDFRNQFGTLELAMYTLFQRGVLLDDDVTELNRLRNSSLAPGVATMMLGVHLIFVLISTWTVLNMLIGVCCEVAAATKTREIKNARWATSSQNLTTAFTEIDEDETKTISKREFDIMTEKPVVLSALRDLDVEPKDLVELSDAIFEPDEAELRGRELSFEEFLELIENNKPSNVASKLDMASLRNFQRRRFTRLENIVQRLLYCASSNTLQDLSTDELEYQIEQLQDNEREMRVNANAAIHGLEHAKLALHELLLQDPKATLHEANDANS